MGSVLILKIAIIACCFAYCFAGSDEVGNTRVVLDGTIESCRSYACNFGNLIVQAMIDYNLHKYKPDYDWTDAAIALHNSGSLAASIPKSTKITKADVYRALPYNDKIVKMDLTGELIREMLEHSVDYLNENNTCVFRNAFLHFEGLQVDYNLNAKRGSRVNTVFIRCAQCKFPYYEPFRDEMTYKVLITDYIANGGDGYDMIKTIAKTSIGATVDEVVIKYLNAHGSVYNGVDRRMTFSNDTTPGNMKKCIVEKSRDLPHLPKNTVQKGGSSSGVCGIISIIFPSIIALIVSR